MAKVVRSGPVPTASDDEICNLLLTGFVVNTIDQSVSFNNRFVVLISENVGITVNRAIYEFRPLNIDNCC